MTQASTDILFALAPNGVGLLTLNRPQALNALSLPMIRALAALLLSWRDDPQVCAVALRGSDKTGPFGAFCAGGDIRFFHQAAIAGDPVLDDFFTEEYALDHLLFSYPKPVIAFMDGIVMGGGMGISQGARCRVVTERTRMAMPETNIGLFPDVGGGYFLSRCPGHTGEYLALTGQAIGAPEALAFGLADAIAPASALPAAWEALQHWPAHSPEQWMVSWQDWAQRSGWQRTPQAGAALLSPEVEAAFAEPSVMAIVQALQSRPTEAARHVLGVLRTRSPLMLHVALEQVRRARHLSYADALRLERGMMRHCFRTTHLQRQGSALEAVEGIRALVVDKDQKPRWQPERIEDVTPEMVLPFFDSPWPAHAHPLRDLA